MKIVAGLGCIDDYIPYVKAGVDEVFVGYVPYEWSVRYGIMLPLNRREVQYYNVQLGAMEELRILKRMVDVYQVPVKITLNSLFYLKEQYELIEQIVTECMEVGFDTFIIADPALLFHLRQKQIPCKIHLSGEIGEVNSKMMEYMNQFQITRYIFHRKNTIKDMKRCIQNNMQKNLEYEAFILNEYCHFTGGFCNSLHCDELTHMCKVPYQMAKVKEEKSLFDPMIEQLRNEDISETKIEEAFEEEYAKEELEELVTGMTGCGLCALGALRDAGVSHLKLVGRGNHTEHMLHDISQLRKALKLLETEGSDQYIATMKKELFPNGCSNICYYRSLGE